MNRIILFIAFFAFCMSTPAYAQGLTFDSSDLKALEAKAKRGCAQCQSILDAYKKQNQDAKAKAEADKNDSIIGTVLEVEGKAAISAPGQDPVSVVLNAPVHLDDVIETGKGARVFILFIDNAEITLSENTKLAIDKWIYDPENGEHNKGVYSILEGTFLYVSGLMAKVEKPDVQIRTPVGSIGVRGTEFWGGYIDGAYGVLVNDGSVIVTTDIGVSTLDKGQGLAVRDNDSKLAAPKAWADEKVQRAVATVHLKESDALGKRIADQQDRQKDLVTHYLDYMARQARAEKEQQQQEQDGQKASPQQQQQQKSPSPSGNAPRRSQNPAYR